jgi:pimeloyl-ACP methyl ester carboxylesterase
MKKTVFIGLVGLLLLFAGQPSKALVSSQGTAMDLEGTLNGARYEIRVPANWNGTLLVYAHGYRDKADHEGERDSQSADAAPGGDPVENLLLSRGYALAGSAYRDNGWAVEEGIIDTLALVNFFKGRVGEPRHTILWGFSMGSVVAFSSAELFPFVYDGVIAACAVGAGSPRTWDGALAFSLAYDVAFGWRESWGSVGDVRDDVNFETEVVPVLFSQAANPLNFGRFEFVRLVNGLPARGFFDGAMWLFVDMFFATEARAELERRAGGPVAQNLNHVYTLTDQEKDYLNARGVNPNALLNEMNARRNISARPSARHYLEHFAEYTGDITRPVLTIHTTGDGLVVVAHESAYREIVRAAGNENLLVQVYTDAVGHCDFTAEQLLAAVAAMQSWLDTGMRPGPEFFPAAQGFLPNFVPPPYPY